MAETLPPVEGKLKVDLSDFKKDLGTAKSEMSATTSHGSGVFSKFGSELKSSLGGVKGDLGGVTGAMGNLASKGGGFMSELQGSVGTAMAGGTAAIAAFAMKGVAEFQDLGLEVGKFRDATGLSAEESSKWVEVAKDMGVGVGPVQAAMVKLEKQLGKNQDAFKQYGLEVAHTKDGQVDANATFLNAVDAINKIQDPAQKATAGAAMFGKGYSQLSEIVAGGSATMRQALDSVQPEKVLNDDAVNKARDLRDGFDKIKDAAEGLLLKVGGALAPVIAQLAGHLGDVVKAASPLVDVIGKTLASAFKALEPVLKLVGPLMSAVAKAAAAVLKPVEWLADGIGKLTHVFDGLSDVHATVIADGPAIVKTLEAQRLAAQDTGEAADKLEASQWAATGAVNAFADAAKNVIQHAQNMKDAQDHLADAHKAIKKAIEDRKQAEQDLYDAELARVDSQYAYLQNTRDTAAAIEEVTKKLKDKKLSQREEADLVEEARGKMEALAQQYANVNGHAKGSKGYIDDMVASLQNQLKTVDPASPLFKAIQGYIAQLNQIPKNVESTLSVKIAGISFHTTADGDIIGNVPGGKRAAGGPVRANVPYWVGDNRDGTLNATSELFVPGRDGTILNQRQLAGVLGGGGDQRTYQINVNVAPGGNLAEAGRQVVDAIVAFERVGSSSWRNS